VTALLAGGCLNQSTLATRVHRPTLFVEELLQYPALDVECQAEIGNTMISSAKRAILPAIRLREEVFHSGIDCPGTLNEARFSISIPLSVLAAAGTDNMGTFYEADSKLNLLAKGKVLPVRGGPYVPKSSSTATEVYFFQHQ
jgi:hypothetical protein